MQKWEGSQRDWWGGVREESSKETIYELRESQTEKREKEKKKHLKK